jgi:hypothetical protein
MKLGISQEIFEKYSVKFHKNPSSESRVVPCGRTDMKKLKGSFRNFANAPKKQKSNCEVRLSLSVAPTHAQHQLLTSPSFHLK